MFVPLGVQKMMLSKGKIYLVNCARCGTTLSCSKHFYEMLKFQEMQVEAGK